MARLSLFLLGPFKAVLCSEPLDAFESNKARALLAYLAVESDRPHTRSSLAALLWPERPEQSARMNLRSTLSKLRQTIGDREAPSPLLLITRDTLQFNAAADAWVDVLAFRSLLDPGSARLPEQESLERAVSLYRGPFLEGFPLAGCPAFDDWSLLTRERLLRQVQGALQRLAVLHESQGRFSRACEAMRRVAELEPWQEEAHRELMRLLALDGRRSAALTQYEACRRTLMAALGVEPTEETRTLYASIRDGVDFPHRSADTRHNLPLPLDPLIGRENELADVRKCLEDPACRLLTIIGPGGIGKTRLALQSAADQVGRFEDGVFWVDLAPVRSPELLASTIIESLGTPLHGNTHPDLQLLDRLRDRHLLLLLDNFEHLLGRTTLVAQMLTASRDVRVLVTSRERLNLRDEWLFPLEGLPFPEASEVELGESGPSSSVAITELAEYDAVRLFVERARQVAPRFSLEAGNAASVGRICCLVEGMPLAIELAAPWVRIMPCEKIAEAIERDIGFLASSLRDLPSRHQSMQAVFEHSWRLLPQKERRILGCLSVFRGGFLREAAEAVAGAHLTELSALVDSSWLRATPSGRYEMHELVRQYVADRLELDRQVEDTRDRHCEFYTSFLEQREARLGGRTQKEALEEILEEVDNVRAAWGWATERCHVQALGRAVRSLGLVSQRRGWFVEMDRTLDRTATVLRKRLGSFAAEQQDPQAEQVTAVLSEVLAWQAHDRHRSGSSEDAILLLEEGLTLLGGGRLSRRQQKAKVLVELMLGWILGSLAKERGRARRLLEEVIEKATELSEDWSKMFGLWFLGMWSYRIGHNASAERYLREGLAVADNLQDRWHRLWFLRELAWISLTEGDHHSAHSLAEGSYRLSLSMGERVGLSVSLVRLGEIAVAQGEYQQAEGYFRNGLANARQMSDPQMQAESLVGLGMIALLQDNAVEGKRLLDEALSEVEKIPPWSQLGVLVESAYAALSVGHDDKCEELLGEALRLALETGMIPRALDALQASAHLAAHRLDIAAATEYVALVLGHPAALPVTTARATRLLSRLEAELPPDAFESAMARGQARELEPTIAELLEAR